MSSSTHNRRFFVKKNKKHLQTFGFIDKMAVESRFSTCTSQCIVQCGSLYFKVPTWVSHNMDPHADYDICKLER